VQTAFEFKNNLCCISAKSKMEAASRVDTEDLSRRNVYIYILLACPDIDINTLNLGI